MFVFRDFNVHHKDYLTYSGGTHRPGELCYNFFISTALTQMVSFLSWIPDSDSHSPGLLDFFISSNASIFSTTTFPPFRNSDHVAVSVCIGFPSNSKQDVRFHRISYDYSRADWDDLCDYLRNVPWKDILQFSASTASELFELVQAKILCIYPS